MTVEIRPRLSSRAREDAREHRVSLLDAALAPLWALGWLTFWVVFAATEGGRLATAALRLGWADAREGAQARKLAARWPVTPRRKARHGPG